MNSKELIAVFDQQAAIYDEQWSKTAPINQGLHFLLESVFAQLPHDARILCVGAGTGADLIHLAKRFPRWSFTAVEPARGMLQACKQHAEKEKIADRCVFFEGFVDALPTANQYDAATCFLVSQFLMQRSERVNFFRSIAQKIRPGAILASSDLSSAIGSPEHSSLVSVWTNMLSAAGASSQTLEKMQETWKRAVAILPAIEVEQIIKDGGFENPTQFYQAGLIRAWFAKRASNSIAY